MSKTLIQEQKDAVEMIRSTKGPVRLLGAAGMGKSTTIDAIGDVVKAAPTNKAAALIGCQTIHKLLGLTVKKRGGKMVTVATSATPKCKIHEKTVFDESSCIPQDILDKYILPIFTNPVFVGDEAQLNPVVTHGQKSGNVVIPFMRDTSWPTMRLKTCHRFGEELYDVAMSNRRAVLEGGIFSVPANWGVDTGFLLDNFKEGDAVIAWRNETVKRYNNILKERFFGTTDWCVGERVRIGEFYEPKRLPNESEWDVIELLQPSKAYGMYADTLRLRGEFGDVIVPVLQEQYKDDFDAQLEFLSSEQNWPHYWGLKNAFCDVRPIFAITAHKSQGSTYGTVFTDLNDIFANKWLQEAVRAAYVATTRARKKVWSLL